MRSDRTIVERKGGWTSVRAALQRRNGGAGVQPTYDLSGAQTSKRSIDLTQEEQGAWIRKLAPLRHPRTLGPIRQAHHQGINLADLAVLNAEQLRHIDVKRTRRRLDHFPP